MAQVIADRRDVDFVLHEQLDIGALSRHDKFAEFNKKTVDLIVKEARNLAIKLDWAHFILDRKYGFDEFNQAVFAGGSKVLGKFLWILHRQSDGSWLLARDSSSADRTPQPPTSSSTAPSST